SITTWPTISAGTTPWPTAGILTRKCCPCLTSSTRTSFRSLEMSWPQARDHCRENYADLVSIMTKKQNQTVFELVGNQNVWIGLHNNWKWSDGTDFAYSPTPLGVLGNNLNCAYLGKSVAFSSCSIHRPFYCYKSEYL
uniref:C-type lectin domain-containing protein n=1 Tax=Denticeps clupeoides TaxID=299321 RepID=A0AAY4D512_9TELE